MTDVEKVARAIWETPISEFGKMRSRKWPPSSKSTLAEYMRQACAAMSATREIDAEALRDSEYPCLDCDAADWLSARAKEMKHD